MRQALQASFLRVLYTVSIALLWGGFALSVAQISIENDTPLDIRFSDGESSRNDETVVLSYFDISSILSPEFELENKTWQEYSESSNNVNFFINESEIGTALGRIQIGDSSEQTLFGTSFVNNSEYSFGSFVLSYDFLYNFFESEDTHSLQLKFRINDGDWIRFPDGSLELSSLQSPNDSWTSFSNYLNIDDIYLRPTDTIHFLWVINSDKVVEDRIPIAVQGLEIFPERIEMNIIDRGDLIISEISPVIDLNGSAFEYLEIYNPSETTISLKGVEIKTEYGTRIIQQDVSVEPYNFTVISNVDMSSIEGVGQSYFYSEPIISPDGGRIELTRSQKLISSATYPSTDPGAALELTRIAQAFDGISRNQDFETSVSSYFQDLYGSPGRGGSTIPMFKKNLEKSGVYLLSYPGNPLLQLNQNLTLEFFSLNGDRLELSAIKPYTPVIVQKTDDTPITLFAEYENQNNRIDNTTSITERSQFLSLTEQIGTYEESSNQSRNLLQSFPITQVWDPESKKFDLLLTDRVESDSWSPILVNESVAGLIQSSDNEIRSPLMDRFIEFGVLPENQESSVLSDVVMIGFMNAPREHSDVRYDLPKLSFERASDNESPSNALLYLTSGLSSETFNSFTHLPKELENDYELGLGIFGSDNNGTAILRWNLSSQLPDEWIITLEDTYTGTIVNVSEVDEYRFRISGSGTNERDPFLEKTNMSTINPSERARFVVNIKPYQSFSTADEEDEVPSSIELRPNYPNPFNPSTNINFYLPEERNVRVGIYNIVGQQVAMLVDDVVSQGEHSLLWDASNNPSGIYIVQLETGNRIFTRKITLIK